MTSKGALREEGAGGLTCLAGSHLLWNLGAGSHHPELLESVLGLAKEREGRLDLWRPRPGPCLPTRCSVKGTSPGADADLGLHAGGILQRPHRLRTHGVASFGEREPALGRERRAVKLRNLRVPALPPQAPTSSTRAFSAARFASSSSRSPSSCRRRESSSARGFRAAMGSAHSQEPAPQVAQSASAVPEGQPIGARGPSPRGRSQPWAKTPTGWRRLS